MNRRILLTPLLALLPALALGATPFSPPVMKGGKIHANAPPLTPETLESATKGDPDAQVEVGNAYHHGAKGAGEDDKEALQWFRKAAEQGHIRAQALVGAWYSDGAFGTPKDRVEGAKWYLRAAKQGDQFSQFYLGLAYFEGRGVPKDPVQAHLWFTLAGAATRDSSVDPTLIGQYRSLTEKAMTPDQRAEAEKLEKEWKPVAEARSGSAPAPKP